MENLQAVLEKVLIKTGDTDQSQKDLISDKVLGYGWDSSTDMMKVELPINLSKKKGKKLRTAPDIKDETLHLLETTPLTKRVCLRVTNSFVDFMGLACPFILRFKLLMKELFQSGYNWDEEIQGSKREEWIKLLAEAVKTEAIYFPRAARPENVKGNPTIVSFGDGAEPAYCACIYIRWKINNESTNDVDFSSNLLCAKAKVTPLEGLTTPRVELNGMLLQTRLTLSVVRALSTEPSLKPTSVNLLSDSECTIGVIDKVTSPLKPYREHQSSNSRYRGYRKKKAR